jgi:hypothetical protein
MNGAESLVRTLVGSGVNACFGNPGTSEMPFRRGPRQGRRHADRAGSFRGRRNGDGRGLRPHGGKVRGHPPQFACPGKVVRQGRNPSSRVDPGSKDFWINTAETRRWSRYNLITNFPWFSPA